MDRRIVIAAIVALGGLAAVIALTDQPDTVNEERGVSHATPTAAEQDEWDRADSQIVRLSPDEFPSLPARIQARLLALECTIPQAWGEPGPHNVITGRFVSGQNADWAVLCSRQRASSILVFPDGSADSMMELEGSPDRGWLQGTGGGRIGFSRVIEVAGPEHIEAYFKAFGGPEPPPLEHDGINDIFVDKASVIRYWHGGRWLELQGAD